MQDDPHETRPASGGAEGVPPMELGTRKNRIGSLGIGETMTKQEIDRMMRDLPSQRMYREEPLWEKIVGGLSFVALLVILCFM